MYARARKQLYEIRVYFVFSRTGFKTSQSQQCEVSLYFQQSSYKPHSAGLVISVYYFFIPLNARYQLSREYLPPV